MFGPPEGPPEVVLVAVSNLSAAPPLGREYGSLADLKRVVERQDSRPGGYSHLYVYAIEPDGGLSRVFYVSADAEEIDLLLRR